MAEILEVTKEHSSNKKSNPIESMPDDCILPMVHVQEILSGGTDSQEE
jgi:hypothetical protein